MLVLYACNSVFLFSLCLFFNHRGYFLLSRIFSISIVNITSFILEVLLLGGDAGVRLVLLPMATFPFIIFDKHEWKSIAFCVSQSVILFLVAEVLYLWNLYSPYYNMQEDFLRYYYLTIILTTFVLLILLVNYFYIKNIRFQANLEELNSRLAADIERRKVVEEGLKTARLGAEAASRAKSEFLANMSHEIRTPLNAIILAADIIEDSNYDKEQTRQIMKTFQSNGNSLLNIINDILDLSKIEAGSLQLEERPFDPDELLDDVFKVLLI